MKGDRFFVDTNILVYSYDISAGDKHTVAKDVLNELWEAGNGLISTQVLQEFFVTVTRKISKPMEVAVAKEIVKDLLKWKVVTVSGGLILDAIELQQKYRYSFWDSLIIASGIHGGASTILSEDLADTQKIKGVVIRNPFSALSKR